MNTNQLNRRLSALKQKSFRCMGALDPLPNGNWRDVFTGTIYTPEEMRKNNIRPMMTSENLRRLGVIIPPLPQGN